MFLTFVDLGLENIIDPMRIIINCDESLAVTVFRENSVIYMSHGD
jgi:hypothetical protein